MHLQYKRSKLPDENRMLISVDIPDNLDILKKEAISMDDSNMYTAMASIFQEKCEREDIDSESYIDDRWFDVRFISNNTQRRYDLFVSYIFVPENILNEQKLYIAPKVLSKYPSTVYQQGSFQSQLIYLVSPDEKIGFKAVLINERQLEMDKLNRDGENYLS